MGFIQWGRIVGLCKGWFFQSLTSKLLYITGRKISDIEPYVVLLTTSVTKSNVDYWKKLRICISYLNQKVGGVRTVGVFNLRDLFTWVDASYALHPNMRRQIIGVMPMVYGMIHCQSSKKKMNENISTEA